MSAEEVLAVSEKNWRVDIVAIKHLWYYVFDTAGDVWNAPAGPVTYYATVEIHLVDGSKRKLRLRRFEEEDRPGLRRFRDLLGDRVSLGKP